MSDEWIENVINGMLKDTEPKHLQNLAQAVHNPWHINLFENGVPAKKFRITKKPDGIHANHPNYDRQVDKKLEKIQIQLLDDFNTTEINNVPADEVSKRLKIFQKELKDHILANPDTKINDLILP